MTMNRRLILRTTLSLPIAALLLAACGDDTGFAPGLDASIVDAGSAPSIDGAMDAGPAPAVDGSVASVDGSTRIRGIAVLGSDYVVSSLSLLDRAGNLVQDDCLNSGTGGATLGMTLSGDVVLPSASPAGAELVLVDRGNAVLTWLDPTTCKVSKQLSVATGFASNPHDIAVVSATRAYVPRADDNATPTPAAGDYDEGSDLLIVDPSMPAIVGRIDLKPFAPTPEVLPRADRALFIDGTVYVSLNAVSASYINAVYADGRVLMVDPISNQVKGMVDLPGAKNCGAMDYEPTHKRLLVACTGAYGDGPQQAATSAIVAIDVGTSPPTIVAQVPASTAGGLPFGNGAVAALDGNTVLGVTLGNLSNLPADRLWAAHLDGTAPVQVFESSEGYALSALLADRELGRAFLADAPTMSPAFLREFDAIAGALTAGKTIKTDPAHKLPPRALAWF
jgi:hypothetical protein